MGRRSEAREVALKYLSKHRGGTNAQIASMGYASHVTQSGIAQATAKLHEEGVVKVLTKEGHANVYGLTKSAARSVVPDDELDLTEAPAPTNGNTATHKMPGVPKGVRAKVTATVRLNNALDVLFPDGLKNVDTHLLLQWIDMTKELIGG